MFCYNLGPIGNDVAGSMVYGILYTGRSFVNGFCTLKP